MLRTTGTLPDTRSRATWLTGFAYGFPLAGLMLAGLGRVMPLPVSGWAPLLETVLLVGTSFACVHHAEAIANRIGQPFGTLVLTLSVTVIEVSVLVSMMLHGENNPTLAREAVLSTVMFVCSGIVGACLLLGALRHREQEVRQQGVNGYLSVIIAISVLCLLLPASTRAGLGGSYYNVQVAIIMAGTVLLYGAFLFMQTVRHREDFLAEGADETEAPTAHRLVLNIPFLIAGLVGVVALSSGVAAGVEDALDPLGLPDPDAVVGAAVVGLLLLPETITAIRAARRNQLQRSINTALGSALATIGLTMPAMFVVSELVGRPIVLGLDPEDRTQLLLVLVLSIVSFGTGRTNLLNGFVHLVLFAIYVMTLFLP